MGELESIEKPLVVSYTEEDFHLKCSNTASKFDEGLCERWDHAMSQGLFRYNLDSVESKTIPGKFGFIAKLNEMRFTQRRAPQHITGLNHSFDPEKFNFTKIPDNQIMALLCPKHRSSIGKHTIIINSSPLEYGNVLFVPNAYGQLPQVLTEEAISLTMEMMLLSNKRDFRAGFNSLGAFASVNHLHLHAFYSPDTLPVENTKVSCISDGFYETVDYPIKAFVYKCSDVKSIELAASLVFQVTSYLHNNELAYNVFFTRGQRLAETGNSTKDVDALRVYIWARRPSLGTKNENVFNIAVYELSGFLPIKERLWYNDMTEDDVCKHLKDAAIEQEQYDQIRTEIVRILANHKKPST